MDNILSCPFCGGEAAIGTGPNYSFVNCTQCLASTNLLNAEGIQPDESEAISAWNQRAGGKYDDAKVDALIRAAKRSVAMNRCDKPRIICSCSTCRLISAIGDVQPLPLPPTEAE